MCKYCERPSRVIGVYLDYPCNGHHYIQFNGDTKDFSLETETSAIQIFHCPWCGRELEPPQDEEVKLEGELNRLRSSLYEVQDKAKYNGEFALILSGRIDALCDTLSDIYCNGDEEHYNKFKEIKRKTDSAG